MSQTFSVVDRVDQQMAISPFPFLNQLGRGENPSLHSLTPTRIFPLVSVLGLEMGIREEKPQNLKGMFCEKSLTF
jgi:hypothetical protein